MSTAEDPGRAGAAAPSEEELRAAYEAELARITATDMIAQAAVSLLNVGARRIGPPPPAGETPPAVDPATGRDLEQVRDAIDAARALLGILERRIPGELGPLRDALSRLQMAYAGEVRAAGGPEPTAAQQAGGAEGGQPGSAAPGGQPGPATPDGAPAPGQQPGPATRGGAPAPGGQPAPDDAQRRPGPAESSGRLWVPGR